MSTPAQAVLLPTHNAAQVAAQGRLRQQATAIVPAKAPLAAAEIISPPSPAEVAALKQLAQRFSSAVSRMRNDACELAYCGYRLQQANAWSTLGFRDELDFATAHGLSESTWKTYAKLGGRLQHMELGEMQGLSLAAANQLVRVSSTIWDEYSWIEEAKLLSAKEFAMLVAERNKQAGLSLASPERPSEPRIALDVTVPASQKRVLKQKLEDIRRREKLPTTADALTRALSAAEQMTELEHLVHQLNSTTDQARYKSLLNQILTALGGSNAVLQAEIQSTRTHTNN